MSAPLLFTKLYIPPPRPKIVLRPRLIERLNEGLSSGCKLTLFSASAGFGKTTLVSEWVESCDQKVAWLSLDEGDNDPTRFLTYLVAALQTIAANIGAGASAVLQSPQPPSTESILTTLLNEITTISDSFILVLDDYHVIDAKPVDQALTFLVEHQPPRMHLVIATREDPPLPLARLRARGQLTEMRAADLRFTPAEAAEFLNQMMGLNLLDADIAALEARTEGWIAGLQLAALSMQGRPDTASFIQAFTGSHRYVLDYLAGEVLERQPERVRNFLLRTAILERLSGSLCDAVTAQDDGRGMLETLERDNLFVVPLDDRRQWYRYHHLFADVLRMHLMAEQPDLVPVLHERASEWYEHNGSMDNAIHHALAAEDFERAATLVELAVPEIRRNRQGAAVTELGWLKALPDELIRCRPVLCVAYAYALFGGGELEGVEPRLRDAERWLETTTDRAGMIVVDEVEFCRLPAMIALLRTAQALARGDMPATEKNARRALEVAPENAHLMLGGAASSLGLVAWTNGDLETARRMTADGMAEVRLAGYISPAIGGALVLADIQIAQGSLHEAMTTYKRALEWATESGTPVLRGTADMYVGMSVLHCQHNDLQTAEQHLLTSQALGELAGLPQNPYRWCAAMARIRQAQGEPEEALDLLDQAERLYDGNFSPNVRPIAARKARVWLAQGRLNEALAWVREKGLSAETELSYLHEFDTITLARVLLAIYQSDHADRSIRDVLGLLERLLKSAEERGGKGSLIEILLLQALAYHAQDDIPAALKPLQKALTLAEPEGYVRIFVDEGEPMRLLISNIMLQMEKRPQHAGIEDMEGMKAYIAQLLVAFSKAPVALEPKSTTPALAAGASVQNLLVPGSLQGKSEILPEPLSQRELEVLRMFKTELSGPEIARQLVIALSTVRTHSKRIYSKLNVNNRRAAVKRAVELNLI